MSSTSYLTLIQEQLQIESELWLEDFYTFLRFASISSEVEYKQPLLECADWVSHYLKGINFKVDYWETSGHPTLFASNLEAGPDKPTLLIYHHYDVQPVDPLDLWESPPFEPLLRDNQVYARGAQDNKGQCFYTLLALKYIMKLEGKLPINIKLIVEGEEETGSQGLATLLETKKDALKADYLAIVDLEIPSISQPAVTLGIRGIVTMDIIAEGSKSDLHSGMHGGMAPNPIHALSTLFAGIRDSQGKITIPGFYQDVKPLSESEKQLIFFDFNEDEFSGLTGTTPSGGELNFPALERAWTRPTIEINGIQGGYTGSGFKTVIPSKALAKVSCRLVPQQDPEHIGKLVADYFKAHAPKGIKISVHLHPGQGGAARVPPESKIVKAFSKAYSEVFGTPCKYALSGGSIPIASALAEASEAELVLVGLGLTTDLIHAPNEHFGLDRIEKGACIIARVIELISHSLKQAI